MRYAEVIGRSDGHVSFAMRCSACGVNLHRFAADIDACRMRYCPKCGRFLRRRSRLVRNEDIVRMLNNQHTVLAEAPRNCDRYRTAAEAEAAFDRWCLKTRTGKCQPATCELPNHTGAGSCFAAWLYAKAEGKEKCNG